MRKRILFQYIPSRYQTVSAADIKVRNLVLKFKDGNKKAILKVAGLVCKELRSLTGSVTKEVMLACVPTSDNKKYVKRFARLSELVAAELQQQNAFPHIEIFGFRDAKHLNRDHMVHDDSCYQVRLDTHFFRGKKVVIFDDLITSGKSAEAFRQILEEAGAEVLGGIFLAETTKGVPYNIKPVGLQQYIIEPVDGLPIDEFFEKINQINHLIYSENEAIEQVQ
ncbi:MAG: ribonucleotide-diphosphate reductase subunit alpha [Prevotella sp.]|nr:ribonucleotide-diphosphate reductase subunit alpha [Prevotella sp.]